MFRWTGAAMALITLIPAALLAQDRDHDRNEVRMRVDGVPTQTWTVAGFQKARLGLSLNVNAAEETRKLGALVMEVTEGSGAEDAGIRPGDIITRYNSTALGGENPAERLVELASDLEEGDSVKIEYRRDGRNTTVTVVARELQNQFSFAIPAIRELRRGMPTMTLGDGNGSFSFFTRGAMMGLELADMNSGLSEYFGTSEGLLVLSVDEDSKIPLQAGDVIMSIGGREPNNAGHAMRILNSYAPGESVKIEVMRKRSRQTIDWSVPEREMKMREGRMKISPSAPARRSVSPAVRVSPRFL